MTSVGISDTGLRTVYQLGGDWFWFFLVVIAGLSFAAWAAGLAVDAVPIAPDVRG